MDTDPEEEKSVDSESINSTDGILMDGTSKSDKEDDKCKSDEDNAQTKDSISTVEKDCESHSPFKTIILQCSPERKIQFISHSRQT